MSTKQTLSPHRQVFASQQSQQRPAAVPSISLQGAPFQQDHLEFPPNSSINNNASIGGSCSIAGFPSPDNNASTILSTPRRGPDNAYPFDNLKFDENHLSTNDLDEKYFSQSYEEAASKFEKLSKKIALTRFSLYEKIKICPDRFEPNNPRKNCNMQFCVISLDKQEDKNMISKRMDDQTRVLVLSSGTHGVEGYAGSAIQLYILNKLIESDARDPRLSAVDLHRQEDHYEPAGFGHGAHEPFGYRQSPGSHGYAHPGAYQNLMDDPVDEIFLPSYANTLLVLVHAINPYGMKYNRRWNENNVDLNRNALHDEIFKKLCFRDIFQSTYDHFDQVLNMTKKPSWFYQKIGIWFRMLWNVLKYGIKDLKTALVAATYKTEHGVFFGGKELQRSHVELKKYFKSRFGGDVHCRNVFWTDIHTGLGKSGIDVMIGSWEDRHTLERVFPKIPNLSDGFSSQPKDTIENLVKKRCGEIPMDSGNTSSKTRSHHYSVDRLQLVMHGQQNVASNVSSPENRLPLINNITAISSASGSSGCTSSNTPVTPIKGGHNINNPTMIIKQGLLSRFLKIETKQLEGYEFTVGVLGRHDWIGTFFKPKTGRVLACTQEFGTCSNLWVCRALILEMAGYLNDTPERHRDYWSLYTRDVFYPISDRKWKRNVISRGVDVFGRMIAEISGKKN